MKYKIILLCALFIAFSNYALANPCYEVWNGPDVNADALSNCKILAEKGNVDAQLEYGLLLLRLPDKYKDLSQGILWVRRSAESGNKYAQVGMAHILSNDKYENILLNYAEAYAWFAVLDDEASMKNVTAKMNKQEIELSMKLAQEYVKKYKQNK